MLSKSMTFEFLLKNGRFEPSFFSGGGTNFHGGIIINEQHHKDVFW